MPMFYYCGKLFKDKPFPSVHSGLLNEGSGAGHGSWTTREALSFPAMLRSSCAFVTSSAEP